MHRNARMSLYTRRLLVARVRREGWTVTRAAEAAGVSRTTAHKLLRRSAEEGDAGLRDRSCRPHRCPRALPAHRERRVLRARAMLRRGPHRLARPLRMARSTIYAVLRRHGQSRLRDADRPRE